MSFSPSSLICSCASPSATEFHLFEYLRRKFEYVYALRGRLAAEGPGRQATLFGTRLTRIKPFSEPYDRDGYNDSIISHELIADLYIFFSVTSRANESGAYLRTLSGSLSFLCRRATMLTIARRR